MTVSQDLIAKAERRQILFGIVGLGYVGLPLAVELARAGYRVLGFDVNPDVVEGLNEGRIGIGAQVSGLVVSTSAAGVGATTAAFSAWCRLRG